MSWDEVLADLDAKVATLETTMEVKALEELDATPFAPPEVEGDMTPAQRTRAVALLERVGAARQRLEAPLAEQRRQLAGLDTRRRGARSYATSDL